MTRFDDTTGNKKRTILTSCARRAGHRSGRLAAAAGITAMTTLVTVAGQQGVAMAAGTPDRVSVDISQTYTDDFLTEACGTTVIATASGTVEITLWRNADGLVVRELDRFPGAFFTWTAPETGQTVRSRYDVGSMWEYGDGAVVGGPVTFAMRGLFFHIPGTSAIAGREVSVSDVDFFEGGVPIVEDGELVSLVGHWPQFDFVEEMCSALTK